MMTCDVISADVCKGQGEEEVNGEAPKSGEAPIPESAGIH